MGYIMRKENEHNDCSREYSVGRIKKEEGKAVNMVDDIKRAICIQCGTGAVAKRLNTIIIIKCSAGFRPKQT